MLFTPVPPATAHNNPLPVAIIPTTFRLRQRKTLQRFVLYETLPDNTYK